MAPRLRFEAVAVTRVTTKNRVAAAISLKPPHRRGSCGICGTACRRDLAVYAGKIRSNQCPRSRISSAQTECGIGYSCQSML